jgi:hypothetical protein
MAAYFSQITPFPRVYRLSHLPDMTDPPIDPPDTPVLRRPPVILVVAPELGVKGFLLFTHRHVSALLAPFGNRLQAPSQPLLHRSHMHCEFPFPAAGTDVCVAEKIERVRLLPLPLRLPRFRSSELQ